MVFEMDPHIKAKLQAKLSCKYFDAWILVVRLYCPVTLRVSSV